MARSFDGTSQYLNIDSAVISTFPCTLAGWCYKTDTGANGCIVAVGNSTADEQFRLNYNGSEDMIAASESVIGGQDTATSSGAGANNVWTHGAAVFRTSTSRDAYRNGANKGSDTNANIPLLLDRTRIGELANTDTGQFFPGYLADVAIWNIDLSDTDVAALAKGVSPLHIRPDYLVAYWPLAGRHDPEIDRVGGYNMTLVNAPPYVSNHPRLHKLYRQLGKALVTAGATFSVSDSVSAVGVAIHTLLVGKVGSPTSTGVAAASALIGKLANIDAPAVATSTFSAGVAAATNAVGVAAHTLQVGVVATFNAVGVATATLLAGLSATATAVGTAAHTLMVALNAAVDAIGVASSTVTSSVVFPKFIGHVGAYLIGPDRWRARKDGWKARRATWRPK